MINTKHICNKIPWGELLIDVKTTFWANDLLQQAINWNGINFGTFIDASLDHNKAKCFLK